VIAATYVDHLERDGFAVVPGILDERTVDRLVALMARAGTEHGKRNVLAEFDEVREVAREPQIHRVVESVVGANAFAVRGLFFDKTPAANWMVGWHQHRTIAVRVQRDVPGFRLWTMKAGLPHVQPTVNVLEQMLTVRLHFDDTDDTNGALRVIPGSHLAGFIAEDEINDWVRPYVPAACLVPRGGALLMRPLLLHASSKVIRPAHRRILHLEYAAHALPSGLEWAFSV